MILRTLCTPVLPSALTILPILVLSLLSETACGDEWVFEVVEQGKQFTEMTQRSLCIDEAGHPHIAYGQGHLYYVWFDGVSWHFETVDNSPEVGSHAALALDSNGYPHFSYHDNTNDDLKYARFGPTPTELFVPDPGVIRIVSVAPNPFYTSQR